MPFFNPPKPQGLPRNSGSNYPQNPATAGINGSPAPAPPGSPGAPAAAPAMATTGGDSAAEQPGLAGQQGYTAAGDNAMRQRQDVAGYGAPPADWEAQLRNTYGDDPAGRAPFAPGFAEAEWTRANEPNYDDGFGGGSAGGSLGTMSPWTWPGGGRRVYGPRSSEPWRDPYRGIRYGLGRGIDPGFDVDPRFHDGGRFSPRSGGDIDPGFYGDDGRSGPRFGEPGTYGELGRRFPGGIAPGEPSSNVQGGESGAEGDAPDAPTGANRPGMAWRRARAQAQRQGYDTSPGGPVTAEDGTVTTGANRPGMGYRQMRRQEARAGSGVPKPGGPPSLAAPTNQTPLIPMPGGRRPIGL